MAASPFIAYPRMDEPIQVLAPFREHTGGDYRRYAKSWRENRDDCMQDYLHGLGRLCEDEAGVVHDRLATRLKTEMAQKFQKRDWLDEDYVAEAGHAEDIMEVLLVDGRLAALDKAHGGKRVQSLKAALGRFQQQLQTDCKEGNAWAEFLRGGCTSAWKTVNAGRRAWRTS